MLKKLTLMAMAVGALMAFVAPPASATGPLLVDSLGKGLPVGSTITATSTNTTTQTSLGTLECRTAILTGKIATNANTTASGTGTGVARGTVPANTHTGHCGTSGGTQIHVDAVNISNLHLTRHGSPVSTTGTANFSYTYRITIFGGTAHCTMTGTNVPVKRTGTSTINVNGTLVGSGGFPCPSSGTLNGDFTVTSGGKPVHIL